MMLILLLAAVSLALGSPSVTSVAPGSFTVTCTLGGESCPTGSSCTQTETCGGLCITSQTLPPPVPCTVGINGPCPTGSTCTPTVTCSPSPAACGGACIATAPPANITQAPLSQVACVVGANDCPSGSYCTQTMICGGLCIPTGSPAPTSTVHSCGGYGKPHCPKNHKCVRHEGKNCGPAHDCHGICIPILDTY